jgi:hypothetical protein
MCALVSLVPRRLTFPPFLAFVGTRPTQPPAARSEVKELGSGKAESLAQKTDRNKEPFAMHVIKYN